MELNLNIDSDHQIKLGAHTIDVKFVDSSNPYMSDDHGVYAYDLYCIFINKNDPPSVRFTTYLHEYMHVIEQIYTVQMDHTVLNLVAEGLGQLLYTEKQPLKKKKNK